MSATAQDPTLSEFLSDAERRLAEMTEAVAALRRGAAARKSLAMAAQVIWGGATALGYDAVAAQAGWIASRAEVSGARVPVALLEEAVDLLRRRIAALSGAPAQAGVVDAAGGPGREATA